MDSLETRHLVIQGPPWDLEGTFKGPSREQLNKVCDLGLPKGPPGTPQGYPREFQGYPRDLPRTPRDPPGTFPKNHRDMGDPGVGPVACSIAPARAPAMF